MRRPSPTGTLVDVTEQARRDGFTVPVALTRAVWDDCVAWTDDDTARTGVHQDERGRLHDVLWMAHLAILIRRPRGQVMTYELVRVPREGSREPEPVSLVIHIGPGDDAEPVITIMQPGED